MYLNEDEKELIRDNREKYFSKSVYFPNSKLSAFGLYLSGKHKLVNFQAKESIESKTWKGSYNGEQIKL